MGFDCSNCIDCGKHINDYYDPSKSNTSLIPNCENFKKNYYNCECDLIKNQCTYNQVNLFL